LGEVAWGNGRWLIAANKRSSFWSRKWGYLFYYDGRDFKDLMLELNKAIELAGGSPGRPGSLLSVKFLSFMLLLLVLGVMYLLVSRYLLRFRQA